MHLLFTINENYVSVLETCIRSILRFPCEEGYDLYILHDQLSEAVQQKLTQHADKNTRFHFISVPDTAFSDFPQNTRYPKTMYYRLLAAEFLPKTLDRVLYLDPDIVVIRPLDELYHMPFDGNLFCGATHVRKFLTRLNGARLQMPEDAPYLNSGVLLINLEELRKRPCRQDILAYIEKRQAYFTLPDQDCVIISGTACTFCTMPISKMRKSTWIGSDKTLASFIIVEKINRGKKIIEVCWIAFTTRFFPLKNEFFSLKLYEKLRP